MTWCVGHLVTMSYPDAYDPALKRWSMETPAVSPEDIQIPGDRRCKKQFKIVSGLLNRADVDTIYVCTDPGVKESTSPWVEQKAGVKWKEPPPCLDRLQTEDEILRGVRRGDLAEYDNLAASAYLRAKEDYLMGSIFQGAHLKIRPVGGVPTLGKAGGVLSGWRVMTCVPYGGPQGAGNPGIREDPQFYHVIGSF